MHNPALGGGGGGASLSGLERLEREGGRKEERKKGRRRRKEKWSGLLTRPLNRFSNRRLRLNRKKNNGPDLKSVINFQKTIL